MLRVVVRVVVKRNEETSIGRLKIKKKNENEYKIALDFVAVEVQPMRSEQSDNSSFQICCVVSDNVFTRIPLTVERGIGKVFCFLKRERKNRD
jgi:hypothetical protein